MITPCAPPFACGGGKQAFELAKSLAHRGIQVMLCTINLNGSAQPLEQHGNLTVKRLKFAKEKKLRTLLFSFWSAYFVWLNRDQIDIVHFPSGAFFYFIPSLLMAKLLGKKTLLKITTSHLDDPMSASKRTFGRLLIWALYRNDKIIVTTRELQESCIKAQMPQRYHQLIPNGVDTNYFVPKKGDKTKLLGGLAIRAHDKVVLMVGNIALQKGILALLEAWATLKDLRAHLIMVGEQTSDRLPDGSLLHDQIKAYQDLGHQIHWLPYQALVLPYYQVADLFVLPSKAEGLSNAALEAMSVNLPVVLTEIGGHREIDPDGVAIKFIAVDDVQKLAEAIRGYLENEPVSHTRALILHKFALSSVTDQYLALYQKLLGR